MLRGEEEGDMLRGERKVGGGRYVERGKSGGRCLK